MRELKSVPAKRLAVEARYQRFNFKKRPVSLDCS